MNGQNFGTPGYSWSGSVWNILGITPFHCEQSFKQAVSEYLSYQGGDIARLIDGANNIDTKMKVLSAAIEFWNIFSEDSIFKNYIECLTRTLHIEVTNAYIKIPDGCLFGDEDFEHVLKKEVTVMERVFNDMRRLGLFSQDCGVRAVDGSGELASRNSVNYFELINNKFIPGWVKLGMIKGFRKYWVAVLENIDMTCSQEQEMMLLLNGLNNKIGRYSVCSEGSLGLSYKSIDLLWIITTLDKLSNLSNKIVTTVVLRLTASKINRNSTSGAFANPAAFLEKGTIVENLSVSRKLAAKLRHIRDSVKGGYGSFSGYFDNGKFERAPFTPPIEGFVKYGDMTEMKILKKRGDDGSSGAHFRMGGTPCTFEVLGWSSSFVNGEVIVEPMLRNNSNGAHKHVVRGRKHKVENGPISDFLNKWLNYTIVNELVGIARKGSYARTGGNYA